MKRLTRRDKNGRAHLVYELGDNFQRNASRAVRMLAEYEDTELYPEQIARLRDDMTSCSMLLDTCETLGDTDHILDLLQAEQDGRLITLPCKVGDMLYVLTYDEDREEFSIAEKEVEEIIYSSSRGLNPWLVCCFGGWRFNGDDFDKVVFCTRDKAKTALDR